MEKNFKPFDLIPDSRKVRATEYYFIDIRFFGDITIHEMIEEWRKIAPNHKDKQTVEEKIMFLSACEKEAERKPMTLIYRPDDWFKVDDPIVCYVGECEKSLLRNDFVTGRVTKSFLFSPFLPFVSGSLPYVEFRCDERIHSDDYLNGYGSCVMVSSPQIMHVWEFEYLLKDLQFARFWERYGTLHYLKRFNDALATEAARRKRKIKQKGSK